LIYETVLARLIADQKLKLDDEILVICGGKFDREVLLAAGLKNVTITNLDIANSDYIAPYKWDRQDAENLTYTDDSFDVVIVHAGLHHCYSPHRGLIEMMRVARRAALVFEARDSFLLNIAKHLGYTMDYEIESVSGSLEMKSGGAANSGIPNFIYRWTENEVLKTVRTAEPKYEPSVTFFYNLMLPHERFEKTSRPILRYSLLAMTPVLEAIGKIFPKQSNEFGFLIEKSKRLHPWLEQCQEQVVLSRAYVKRTGRVYQAASPDAPRWGAK